MIWDNPVRYRTLFLLLFVVGVLERCWAAFGSNLAIAHPDEHQQYVEQALRHVHGYGTYFWEQAFGMRHLLFSQSLACILRLLEHWGVTEPITQLALLRLVLSQTIFLLFSWYAWLLGRDGHRAAALFIMAALTLSIYMVFFNVRFLSENAMAVPLLLALLCERRGWLTLSGVFWMLTYAVRFQAAFLIVGLGLWTFFSDLGKFRRGEYFWSAFAVTRRLLLGLVLGTLLVGLLDAYWLHTRELGLEHDPRSFAADFFAACGLGKGFLHSSFMYFQQNFIEDKASIYGVEPWWYYFALGSGQLVAFSMAMPILLYFGAKVRPELLAMIVVFVLGHSYVGHKEIRFLWALAPILIVQAAWGFEVLTRPSLTPSPLWKQPGVMIGAFVVCSLIHVPFFHWEIEPYRSAALALAKMKEYDDVKGVAGVGWDDGQGGNHFFLRMGGTVRLMHRHTMDELRKADGFRECNYLMVHEGQFQLEEYDHGDVSRLPEQRTKVAQVGEVTIYRLEP